MEGIEYRFSDSGEWVFVKVPRCLLCFTRSEWVNAIRRGKSVLRNRAMKAREAKALEAKVRLPRMEG